MVTQAELQQAILDGGYIELPPGKHRLEEPLLVPVDKHVHIDGKRCELEFALPENRGLFELYRNQKWGQGRFWVKNLKAEQAFWDTTRNSVIKTAEQRVQVDTMQVTNCQFRANRGYCIDMLNTSYCVAPVIRNLRTVGAGAIRWIGHRDWNHSDALHATSQLTIENVRHLGGSRIGAAFRLRGCGGLRMRQIIDEGSCNVSKQHMKRPFPLGIHLESPRTPSIIDGYWFEPWGSFVRDAPNQWMFTFEGGGAFSTGKHNYVQVRIEAMKTTAYDHDIPKVKVIGGGKHKPGSRAKHSIFVDMLDAWQPDSSEFETQGKAKLRFIRPRQESAHLHRKLARHYDLVQPMVAHTTALPYIGTDDPDIHNPDVWLRG